MKTSTNFMIRGVKWAKFINFGTKKLTKEKKQQAQFLAKLSAGSLNFLQNGSDNINDQNERARRVMHLYQTEVQPDNNQCCEYFRIGAQKWSPEMI